MCPFAPTVCPFPTVSDRHCVRLQLPCVRFLLCPIGPVSDCDHRVSVSYCVRSALCPFATAVCPFLVVSDWQCVRLPLFPIGIVSDCHCVRLQPPCVRFLLCPIGPVSDSFNLLCPIYSVRDWASLVRNKIELANLQETTVLC